MGSVDTRVHYGPSAEIPKVSRDLTDTQVEIQEECDRLASMLIEKNQAYGDSALQPLNVFSTLPPLEGLKLRMDDKLKRIQNDGYLMNEDAYKDLAGYLILYFVAVRRLNRGIERGPEPRR